MITATEIDIRVMKTNSTSEDPVLQQKEAALKGMKQELMDIREKGGDVSDYQISANGLPTIEMDYVRKLRELKFVEALYALLVKQLESAKLDEARDAVVIQVIDNAVPPERKYKPRRRELVMIVTGIAFFISVFIALILDFVEKLISDPENKDKVELMRVYLWHRGRK